MAKSTRPRPNQDVRDAATERILAHARKHWPDNEVLVRHSGAFCYVAVVERATPRGWRLFRTGTEPERAPFTALRLRYRGDADHWLVGIYKASTESFGEDELPTSFGPLITTPEQAIDHVLGFYRQPDDNRCWTVSAPRTEVSVQRT
ncbi:hypothetical protein ACWDBD_42585 [Streptomyces sp. NPDC001118]